MRAPSPSISLPALGRRSPLDRNELVVIGAGLLVAAAVGALSVASDSVLQPALIGLVAVLCAVPMAVRAIQGRWDPFEPIVLICVAAFVLFVLRPLWMWRFDDWIFYIYDARDALTESAIVVVVGMLGVVLGYAVPTGRRLAAKLPIIRDDWDPSRVTGAAVVVLFLAGLLFSFHIGTQGGLSALTSYFSGRSGGSGLQTPGGETTGSGYFALAPYMTIPVSLLLLEVWRRQRSFAAGAIALAGVATALAMTVPRGDRTWILALALPLIVAPYLRKDRRPRVIAILATVVAAVLVFNVLLEYRKTSSRDESLPSLMSKAVTDPTKEVDDFLLGVDTAMFSALTAEVNAMPSRFDFQPGRQLTSIALAPLPGVVWKGKPAAPGYEVYRELYRPRGGTAPRGGVAVSMFGSFFADGWMIGVFIYSLISGIFFRLLFEYWNLNRSNHTVGLVYAATLPILIMMFRASATLAYGGVLILIAPLVGIVWWASRTPGRPAFLRPPAASA